MKDLHLAIVNEEASCENFTLSRSLIPEKYGRCHMENLGCIFSDFIENEPLFLNVCIFFVKKNFRFIIISSLIWDDLFFILDYVPRCLRVCRIFSKYFFHYIPPLYPSIKIVWNQNCTSSDLRLFFFHIFKEAVGSLSEALEGIRTAKYTGAILIPKNHSYAVEERIYTGQKTLPKLVELSTIRVFMDMSGRNKMWFSYWSSRDSLSN